MCGELGDHGIAQPLKTKVTLSPTDPDIFLSTTMIVRDGLASPKKGSPIRKVGHPSGAKTHEETAGDPERREIDFFPRVVLRMKTKVDSFRVDETRCTLASGVSFLDLEHRLDALAAFCRAEKGSRWLLKAERRRLEQFLESLYLLCRDLQMEMIDHVSYRKKYNCNGPITYFLASAFRGNELVPQNMEQEVFLNQTILLAASPDSCFDFHYNGKTIRSCNCITPDGLKKVCRFAFEDLKNVEEAGTIHYPSNIIEMKHEMDEQLIGLVKMLPRKLEEFLAMNSPPKPSDFARFKASLICYLKMFDSTYSRFERAYLDFVIESVLVNAFSPLIELHRVIGTEFSKGIDQMEGLTMSLLCQNISHLRKALILSGPKEIPLKPRVVGRALRISRMDTFDAVKKEAKSFLEKFGEAIEFMRGLEIKNGLVSGLHPDLKRNTFLRNVMESLEKSWVFNDVILRQPMFNFFNIMIHGALKPPEKMTESHFKEGWLMRNFTPAFRKTLQKGALQEVGDPDFDEAAHKALFEAFPTLLLLDELYVALQTEDHDHGLVVNFREMFCYEEDNDRHRKKSQTTEQLCVRPNEDLANFSNRQFLLLFDFIIRVSTGQKKSKLAEDRLFYYEGLWHHLKRCSHIEYEEGWRVVNQTLIRICTEVGSDIFPPPTAVGEGGPIRKVSLGDSLKKASQKDIKRPP